MNREMLLIYQQIIAPWTAGFNITMTPIGFDGLVAGSEFLIYDVNKLYLTKSFIFGATIVGSVGQNNITLFDTANVIKGYLQDIMGYYDNGAATPYYLHNSKEFTNNYFSRILAGSRIINIAFQGYVINRA